MTDKILLSTDIGSDIDDALALLVMFNSGIDLRGIYTVNGDVVSRAYIAKHMVNLSGKSIDVVIGESMPLEGGIKPYSHFEECYVPDEFIDEKKSDASDNIIFKSPRKVGIKQNGVDELAGKLSNGKYTLFSIGPLTNIARLIEKHPEVTGNIEQLYIMGCRFSDKGELEHNVRYDIPAALKVFGSDLPITVISGDACKGYLMPSPCLEQLESDAGLYIKKMAKGFLGVQTVSEFVRYNLKNLIMDKAQLSPDYLRDTEDKSELASNYTRKQRLIVNLDDSYMAALEPQVYFEQYFALIRHLREPKLDYSKGKAFAWILEDLVPRQISVSDVYVPYCFLSRDKMEFERADITIDDRGVSVKSPGEKHRIVTGLDYKDFEQFLMMYLR